MSVLVDSSVWIDYFRNVGNADELEYLIEEDLIVTNNLILTELIPFLYLSKQEKLISLLKEIKVQPMMIDWDEIIQMQTNLLTNGVNGIGIPDLLIAENAMQGKLKILTNDNHFNLLAKHLRVELY